MLQRLVFLGLFSCLMACDLYVDTKPNEAWRRCKADPCSDGCSADLRATYCDYYVDDPKCDQCWSRSEGGIDGSDSGNDARVDSGDELGGDGGAALCKRDENCSVDEPRCDKGECTGCRDSTDCADREATPACDSSSGACVTCTESDPGACTGTKPLCKSGGNECVECNGNDDCKQAAAPHCGADNTCGGCVDDNDCSRFGQVCDQSSHACVQCTPATEVTQCPDPNPNDTVPAPACDPVAETCTGAPRGTVTGCLACVSDSECINGFACVPTTFNGQPYGKFCMQQEDTEGACPSQFAEQREATTSLGVVGHQYCFPREEVTTCAAVLAFGDSCSREGGCGEGGLCVGTQCTYVCDRNADCSTSCAVAKPRYCNL